jgi:predicted DNA-binding protein (MmcQ/YjbR family)
MVSTKEVTAWAMAYPETVQLPHFEKTSFRVKKKIFVTLDTMKQRAVVKLSEIDQSVFCKYDNSVIFPVPGAWGKQGWTIVELKKVRKTMFKDALQLAYCLVAPKALSEMVRNKNSL